VKSDVQNMSDTRVKLTVELPFDELTEQVEAAYKRIAGQVQIPGFRKGRVPRQIIDQRLGRGTVLEEVVNAAVPPAYDSAIKEAGVHALGQPEVEVTDIVDGERIAFTAEVDVRPEFELPTYRGLQVEVGSLAVTDEDVAEQVEALAARFGSYNEVERPTQNGDVLLVDMDAQCEGEPIDELTARALSFEVGEEGLIPGADEAVVGLSAGETATVEFVPEFGEYKGRQVVATITVNAVREKVLPQIDDELAMMASEFDTLDELRADVRERMERVRLMERGRDAQQLLHEQLLEALDIPLPERLIATEVDSHFEDHEASDDDHRQQVEADARKALKSQFLMDRIADAEDISVGEAELSRWLVSQAPRYGMSADQFAQALVEAGQVPMAVNEVRRSKALALVLESAQITDADGNPVDLKALETPGVEPAPSGDEDAQEEDTQDEDAQEA
jgi:trigger factor